MVREGQKQDEDLPAGLSVPAGNTGKAAPKRTRWNKLLLSLCIIGLVVFGFLFINEAFIKPYQVEKSVELSRELYEKAEPVDTVAAPEVTASAITAPATPVEEPARDSQGRLLQFKNLLEESPDVKGWINIPDTNIDYVVAQGTEDEPDYFLDKDIRGDYSKAGTLYLDISSSVEKDDTTRNLVIHGHNMVSTKEKMFHCLLDYKKAGYYKEHSVITFDTIYNTGQWKVFAVFITNGSSAKEPLFDYRKADFKDASDFLNFVYQIRIRSILNTSVDINENDQILCLSTCSYEVDDYRTVIVARRVRDGEEPTVDVEATEVNPAPLYPASYYYRYGGKAPKLYETFEEALGNGAISWYQ